MESQTYCEKFFEDYPVFNLHHTIASEIKLLPNLFSIVNNFIKSKDKDFVDIFNNHNQDVAIQFKDSLYSKNFIFTGIPIFRYKELELFKVGNYEYRFSLSGSKVLYVDTLIFSLDFSDYGEHGYKTAVWLDFMNIHLNYNVLQFLENTCVKHDFFEFFCLFVFDIKIYLRSFDKYTFLDSFGYKICLDTVEKTLSFHDTNCNTTIEVKYLDYEVLLNGNKIFNYIEDKIYNYKDLFYTIGKIGLSLTHFEINTKK